MLFVLKFQYERHIITCLQCDRFVFIMVRVHQVEINLTQLSDDADMAQ
jgi:hypothetical protein